MIMNYGIYHIIQVTYRNNVLHHCLLLVTFKYAKLFGVFCIGDAFVVE